VAGQTTVLAQSEEAKKGDKDFFTFISPRPIG
jgi:hypothetical protein